MATGAGDLVIRLFAKTGQFNRKMAQARGTMGLVSRAGRMASQGMLAIGVGASSAAASFVVLMRAGEDFNRSMRSSLAIMGDVSAMMRGDMREAAIAMASTTKFSASEAARAYFFLASAGLDAKRSIDALPQVALFAQAGNFDIGKATQLATDAQSALGLKVKDTTENLINLTRVTDVLTKANTLADATTEQFAHAVANKAGAALKIVNKDIEEGVAVLAVFADQGKKGEEAGTALNIVMRELTTKALKFSAEFRAAGVSVFDATGDMNNMADIVADLERSLDGMSDAQKKATLLNMGFTDRSLIFIQMLIGMSENIRAFEAALRDAGGTTKEVADKQLTPLQKGWAKISAAVTDAASKIMMTISPALGIVLEMLGDGVAVATDFVVAMGVDGGIKEFTTTLKNLSDELKENYEQLRRWWAVVELLRFGVADLIPAAQRLSSSLDIKSVRAQTSIMAALIPERKLFKSTFGEGELEKHEAAIERARKRNQGFIRDKALSDSLLARQATEFGGRKERLDKAVGSTGIQDLIGAARGPTPQDVAEDVDLLVMALQEVNPNLRMTREHYEGLQASAGGAKEAIQAMVDAQESLKTPKEQLEAQRELADLLEQTMKDGVGAANLRKRAQEEFNAAIGDPRGTLKEMTDEYERLTTGITRAAQEQRKFLEVGADPKLVAQLREQQEKLDRRRSVIDKSDRQRDKRERDRDSVKAMTERLRSPVEKALADAKEIERLFQIGPEGGGLTTETRRRGLLDVAGGLKQDRDTPRQAAAAQRGSAQAWSTIMGAMNQKNRPKDKAAIDTAKNTKDTVALLEQQADDAPPLNVIPPP